MDVENMLRSMANIYAAMTSYADTGEVTTTFTKTGNVMHTPFSTLYRNPSLFRFDCARPHPYAPLSHIVTQHVVGSDGASTYSRRKKYNELETANSVEKNLSSAIASAAPYSHGAVHTIARLLMPSDTDGLSILDLQNFEIKEETQLGGVSCYVIAAQYPNGSNCELWVEKDTPLLRKIIQTDALARNEEVRANIRVNEPLESGLFAA